MSTDKLKLVVFALTLLIIGVSLIILTQQRYTTSPRVRAEIPESPTPTIIIPGPLQKDEMISPDGSHLVTIESQEMGDRVNYALFTTMVDQRERQTVFATDAASLHRFETPFNAWSPDNRLFFVRKSSPSKDDYYVFSKTGEPFSEGTPYLDVQSLFVEKVEGFTITDVTGWAAPGLLLVNTKAEEGEEVSFWFDVAGQSFIRLGTYFR